MTQPEDPAAAPPARHSLGLFAKQPAPGRTKTRLAAATSAEFAARVAHALLAHALDRFAGVPAERYAVFDPPDGRLFFDSLAAGRYRLEPQAEGDLGRRLEAFFAARFAAGDRAVIAVGTDSPTMPVEWVAEAFGRLENADVVLGPATDGGYYLIGLRRPVPVFTGIAWGTARVLGQTVACVEEAKCSLNLLPPWYDVDTLENWLVFRGHAAALERAEGVCKLHEELRLLLPVDL
jgi:rSAM/selenodomain-associated transferase 1